MPLCVPPVAWRVAAVVPAVLFAAAALIAGRAVESQPRFAAKALPASVCTPRVVDFDIVYVRAPRFGDATDSTWPEVTRPVSADPGADLRLLHPDCTEEVLFPRPEHQAQVDATIGGGSVLDPNVSFDGRHVVFAYLHDQRDLNPQRGISRRGADIYRLNLQTRELVRLTRQEFTPNTGNGAQFAGCGSTGQGANCPNVGVFNVGPAFVAQADPARPMIAFTSSRNNFLPPKQQGGQQRVLQLFTMDWDGRNVQQFGYLNQSLALHPQQLVDGRLAFTSWENQGIRDGRQFNLWWIGPDGTGWNSGSGFGENAIVHHFMTQMPNEDIVVVRYYNQNNNGFGDLVRFPVAPAGGAFRGIDEPGTYMPFQRRAQRFLTNWTDSPGSLAEDFPAPCAVGNNIYNDIGRGCDPATRIGKVTHPAAAPGGDLLVVYTRGAANSNGIYTNQGINRPFYDGGIHLMPRAKAADGTARPTDLVRILDDPAANEQWPRPVVRHSDLFPGRVQPAVWSPFQNAGAEVPADSPFGLIGSSSLTWRDTRPRPAGFNRDASGAIDPDPFNASHEMLYAWMHQGADAGLYSDSDIYALRVLAMIPKTDRSYPGNPPGFYSVGDERLRILGEIPVRKEGTLDPTGSVDTSFLARVPADVPITFQTLDRNGLVVNMAQTWHQVRPGEARYDCGGCHAHSRTPIDFHQTAAGRPGFQPADLTGPAPLLRPMARNGSPAVAPAATPAVSVEYLRDIRPIIDRRCAGCHSTDSGDGRLNLFADAARVQCGTASWPGTYYRLVLDRASGDCPTFSQGVPAGAATPWFIEPQQSRFVRGYQARESLLAWKVFGTRLDGRTNATRTGDIDYDPAADAVHPNLGTSRGLTWEERLTIARWIDLGAPVDLAATGGWHEDDLRPTLWLGPTLEAGARGPVSALRVAAHDIESGVDPGSLVVTIDRTLGGRSAGTNLAAGQTLANGATLTLTLPAAIDLAASRATVTASVRDRAGHLATISRTYGGAPAASVASTWLDFTGDGRADLLWRHVDGHLSLWSFAGLALGAASGPMGGPDPTYWRVVATGDFDGDGRQDLLWKSQAGDVVIWLLDGARVRAQINAGPGSVPTSWTVAGAGDFDGDGKADILWRDAAGNFTLWLMDGGTRRSATGFPGANPAYWDVIAVADVDRDGRADIVWRSIAGDVVTWLMNGAAVRASGDFGPGRAHPSTWRFAGIADLNGDGNRDAVWVNRIDGSVAIWALAGTALAPSGSGTIPGPDPAYWTLALVADIDADGKADLVWTSRHGDVAVWLMDGPRVRSQQSLGSGSIEANAALMR